MAGFLRACGGDPRVVGAVDGVVGLLATAQGKPKQAAPRIDACVPAFSEAAQEYEQHGRDSGTRDKEVGALKRYVGALIELVGDRAMNAYSRRDLEDFAAELRFLPIRHGSIRDLKNASLAQAVAYGRANPHVQRISPRTVEDKYVADVRATIPRGAHRADIPSPIEGAANCRFTQSSGHGAAGSGTVVRAFFPLTAPCRPIVFISLTTVHRAAAMPSRFICRRTLRTLQTPKFSSNTQRTCREGTASRFARSGTRSGSRRRAACS